MTDAHRDPTVHPLRRLWDYTGAGSSSTLPDSGDHRRLVTKAATSSVLNKLFDLAPPFLIGLAVDTVVEEGDSFVARVFGIEDRVDQLWVIAAVTAVIWMLESLFEYLFQVQWRNLAQSIQHEARLDAYAHVQGLEMAYFEDRSTGGLLSVLNDDVNQLERFLDRGANDILQVLTTVLVIGAAMFVLMPTIAPLAFLPVPIILWGSFRFQRTLEPRYADVRERVGLLNSTLSNNLSGIATIKAFTAEDREIARVAQESDEYRESNRAAIRYSSAFIPMIRMAILFGFTAILVLGGIRTINGLMEVGIYSAMVYIVQRLLWPLTRLGETFDLYQRAMASTRRIMDLLAVEPRVSSGTTRLPEVAGEIRFEDVHFAYDRGEDVIRGITLEIPAGETHAIVGSTGAGKSTIVKLLLRLYDVTAGRILLDGCDVRELSFADLRGAIGLVSQDVFLFHGTVRENIAYGRTDATDEEIVRAAVLAEAHEFILALPDGYDTVVGERGQKLSGGQRQRVSIARAIVKDPAILILDEATSSVDNETEAAIQRSLERVARDRTTVVIAHRLSTVRNAHRIHVLEPGRVVEAGTHDELIAAGGLYAALWRVQTGEAVRAGAP
ncbi:MAG: ABC transporter ATP-binding protein/permease [Actinobacteria bacterium]|nr:ABC transporter ATP-binding protein/permease [Actinomycetota bacterium]